MSYEELMAAIADQPDPEQKPSEKDRHMEADPNMHIVSYYGPDEKVERFGVVLDASGRIRYNNKKATEAFEKGFIRRVELPDGSVRIGLTRKGRHYVNEVDEDEQGALRSLDIDPRAAHDVHVRFVEAIQNPAQRILNVFTARYKTYLHHTYGLELKVEEDVSEGKCFVYLENVRSGGNKAARKREETFVVPCYTEAVFKKACDMLYQQIIDKYGVDKKDHSTPHVKKDITV
jgi:hypothetical protein